MPVWNIARIVPNDKAAAWTSATAIGGSSGMSVTGNIYSQAEPVVRTNITHKGGNGAPNAAQLAYFEGLGTDVNGRYIMPPELDGCVAVKWDRSLGPSASPYSGMLSEEGLTTEHSV